LKRARDSSQKAAKKDVILAAAAACFMNNGHKLPSAANVANQAGVAKGTVYLYFKTKETIFLALFSHQLGSLLDSLQNLQPDQSIARQVNDRVHIFLTEQPSFMPLAAMLQSVLESNIPTSTLHHFKTELSGLLAGAGAKMDQRFKFEHGFSEQALIHSYATLLGLWQILQWPSSLADVKTEPQFKPLQRDLSDEFLLALTRIWAQ
jgi:AcrR family transcriptional regulator